jgi:hypothetical protein
MLPAASIVRIAKYTDAPLTPEAANCCAVRAAAGAGAALSGVALQKLAEVIGLVDQCTS